MKIIDEKFCDIIKYDDICTRIETVNKTKNYSNLNRKEHIMSNGEQLGLLLYKANTLNEQMHQIFLKQGLATPDLSLLSSVDKDEWNRLYEESNKISDEVCKLINENSMEEKEPLDKSKVLTENVLTIMMFALFTVIVFFWLKLPEIPDNIGLGRSSRLLVDYMAIILLRGLVIFGTVRNLYIIFSKKASH